jgi:hypothetical protein
MDEFKFFKTFKERGEWIEMRFMAEAMRHGYKVLMPWGESSPFDVALYFGNRIVRVQVKSTSSRMDAGYSCQFTSNPRRPYTLDMLDFFAACVIPQNAWYLIPAPVLLGKVRREHLALCPMQPTKASRYHYECYREAWPLLRPKPEAKKPRAR